jgi:outer membrane receptor protein involved in Fe transport
MFLLALCLCFVAVAAFGQAETGQINGKVTDPHGAVIPGATVTAKNTNTGAERTVQANDSGEYIITNLQPGRYEVTATGSSFQPTKITVELSVGAKTSAEIKMGLQQVAGEVNVVAAGGVEINTQTAEVSNVINGTQITELPTLTRNPYSLATISPNVSSDPQGSTGRGVGVSINGQRAASTEILLDGGENVDTFVASTGQSVPLDSVAEFRIITSNFSAEYGRASGGIVNVATRSGSNEFHGTVFEFNRLSRLASNGFNNNAQGLKKGVFTRNQFGYSLGGPVILPRFGEGGPSTINLKNKLFFFSSTEWTRVRSVAPIITQVPTPELLAASSPETQAFFAAFPLRTSINGPITTVGTIRAQLTPPGGVPPTGAFFNLPDSTPAFGQVRYQVPSDQGGGNPQNTWDSVARIDYNRSSKTQIYGRLALESSILTPGTVGYSAYRGFDTGQTTYNQNYLVSLTRTFTAKLVSQSKLVYNRLNLLQPLGDQPVVPTLFLTSTSFQQINNQTVGLPGYLPFTPGNGIPFGGPQNLGQGFEDLSYTRGKHTFRFGGQMVYIQDNRAFGAYQEANEQLGGGSLKSGLNNLMLGRLTLFQAAVFPQGKFPGETLTLPVGPPDFTRSNRYNDWALYFNDSWRVKPRLTLNLGVRYEYYGVQHNKRPALDSNFVMGSGATIFERIRNGKVFTAPNSPVGGLWKPDRNNFAPRVGFAWDVFGDGKTSIRGGYGLAYERNFGNVTFNVIQNPPNYAVISINPSDVGGTLPITLNNAGPLAGSTGTKRLPPVSLRYVREDIVNAYAHFYSASFERELTPGTVLSVQYSGSKGRKLYSIENINKRGTGIKYLGSSSTNPITGVLSDRLNGQYGNVNTRGNNGFSDYNALIVSLNSSGLRKWIKGLQFTANYTLAKAKDNLSSTFSESNNNFNLGLTDPFNPGLDYGFADFDVRHRISGSFNWAIPYGKSYKGAARQLLDGWSLNGIVIARTGTPFSVYDCTNANFTTCARMSLFTTQQFSGKGTNNPEPGQPNRFRIIDLTANGTCLSLDPSCAYVDGFTPFGGGELGPFPANMSKRNAFRGPGLWNVDMALYKTFRLGERYKLQFRSEFYNILNHANLFVNGSEADISSSNFVTAHKDGRRDIQLAVKFIF